MKNSKPIGLLTETLSTVEIIVMRHGEGEHNIKGIFSSDPEHPNYSPFYLTRLGEKQVRSSAQELKSILNIPSNEQDISDNLGVAGVYHSPLPRTQQTAKILCQELGLPHSLKREEKALIEIKMGDFEGKAYEDFPWEDIWDTTHGREYGGETGEDVLQRLKDFFIRLIQDNKILQGKLIFITHGVPAQILIDWLAEEKGPRLETAKYFYLKLPLETLIQRTK